MNKSLVILAGLLTIAHLALSFITFAVMFGLGMDRFDHGGEPSLAEQAASYVLIVLSFPLTMLAYLSPLRLPVILQFLIVIANSAIWGWLGGELLIRIWRRWRFPRHVDGL